jgi:hypothetical protein
MIEMNKEHADYSTNLFVHEAVQNGLPTRPQVKSSPQTYPRGYVEDADEPRTKLEAVFNSLIL